MADITITVPTQYEARVIEGLCKDAGYTDPADFTGANAKAHIIQWMKSTVKSREYQEAAAAFVDEYIEPDLT